MTFPLVQTYSKKTNLLAQHGISPSTRHYSIGSNQLRLPAMIARWEYRSTAKVKDWHERQSAGREAFFQQQLS